MRYKRTAPPLDIRIGFKPDADAVAQDEIDLLLAIWPNLLQAMQIEANSGQSGSGGTLNNASVYAID